MIIHDQCRFGMCVCVWGFTDARVHVCIHVQETFHMIPVWVQCLGGPEYPRMIKGLGKRAQPGRNPRMFLIIKVLPTLISQGKLPIPHSLML